MITKALTNAQRQKIATDPVIAQIMRDPKYTSQPLRDAAINNYLANDPRSPLRDVFGAGANPNGSGAPAGGLHYDPATGQSEFTNTYGHPGTMKAIGIAIPAVATGGMAALGSAPAAGGAAASTAAASAAPAAVGGTAAATGGSVASGFGSGLLAKIFGNPNVDAALINAGTGLYGTKMQADAASRAAEIQAQSAREALAFLKEQYGQATTNYKPYLDAGTAAVGRMSDQAAHLPSPMSLLGRPQSPAPAASGGMVQMMAPQNDPVTGRPIMKMVRPDQVDHFKALGARMA